MLGDGYAVLFLNDVENRRFLIFSLQMCLNLWSSLYMYINVTGGRATVEAKKIYKEHISSFI